MQSGRAMCRVNPDPVMQGRRGSPAERRKCALTAPDTSADSHCSAPLSALADISSILNAVHKLERSSGWKTGVQRITTDCLCFAIILRRQILTGTYRQQEENIFTVCERGDTKDSSGRSRRRTWYCSMTSATACSFPRSGNALFTAAGQTSDGRAWRSPGRGW